MPCLIKWDFAGIILANSERVVLGNRSYPARNRIIRSAFPPDDFLYLVPFGFEAHRNRISYRGGLRNPFQFMPALPTYRDGPGNTEKAYQERQHQAICPFSHRKAFVDISHPLDTGIASSK